MATLKDLVAEVKKCMKSGETQTKCIDKVYEKYDLDKEDKAELKRMLE